MRNLRVRTLLLALVAVFAMSVVASATASAKTAMPEIVNKEGKFPTKTGFKSTSGASEFETKAGHLLKCTADSDTGKLTGPSSDESTITFTGCSTTDIVTLKCKTEGAKEGEIVLKATSELVWLNKSEESEPGELIGLPAAGLTIKCSSLETLKVTGSTTCPISGFKVLSATGTVTCEQTKGVQKYTTYYLEGTKENKTETTGTGSIGFGPEPSGLKSTDSLTYEEEVEII
jgi:hypothetical protein